MRVERMLDVDTMGLVMGIVVEGMYFDFLTVSTDVWKRWSKDD